MIKMPLSHNQPTLSLDIPVSHIARYCIVRLFILFHSIFHVFRCYCYVDELG